MKAVVLGSMLAAAEAAHWAVIMAGSNTFDNYRHQADSCHAYHIAIKHGIPESNIIHLAYDDIAHNSENPFRPKIFNKPTKKGTPGKDVYEGCKIDYKGKEVNAANFIKVLSGDASSNGPVLKSTAADRVFVYYVDHGGPGILGVPYGAKGGYITAKSVNKALETLHSKGGYKELLFYLEACESGSIFNKLLTAPNVKAVTAASPKESSWGWYCPGDTKTGGDMVDGKDVGACLGDEFSVRWMENADASDLSTETVGEQFAAVKKAVNKSHVQEYGVKTLDSEPAGNFEGNTSKLMKGLVPATIEGDGVDSRQVEVHQAYYRVLRAKTAAERKSAEQKLSAILARRHEADEKFGKIAVAACEIHNCVAEDMLEGPVDALTNVDCHEAALEMVVDQCGSFTDYSLRYSRLFVNLCNADIDLQTVKTAVGKGCASSVVV